MSERVSARVLLIDETSRVLLVSSRDPDDGVLVWYAPGGRIEDGEDVRTAALREIEEEAGIVLDDVTGPIWERRFPHTFDGRFIDGQRRKRTRTCARPAETPGFEPGRELNTP